VRYVLDHSDSKAVFVEDREQLAKVHRIRPDLPLMEQVIVLEPDGGEQEGATSGEEGSERPLRVESA
jgi:long-subunit acyl-CoA synthetase (AMP-forming)